MGGGSNVANRTTNLLLVTRGDSSCHALDLVSPLELALEVLQIQQIVIHGVRPKEPDVLLVEVGLPEDSWQRLHNVMRVPAIILGSANLYEHVIPRILAGARGHLCDEEVESQLWTAIETVLQGEIYAGASLTSRLFSYLAALNKSVPITASGKTNGADLTAAETKVLHLIAQGLSNQGIADTLGLSRHTIANQVHSLLTKLNAKRRDEAVMRAATEE